MIGTMLDESCGGLCQERPDVCITYLLALPESVSQFNYKVASGLKCAPGVVVSNFNSGAARRVDSIGLGSVRSRF